MKELIKMKKLTLLVAGKVLLTVKQLTLRQGEVVGLVGKNGSGKSILLSMMAGQFNDYQGELSSQVAQTDITLVKQEVATYTSPAQQTLATPLLRQRWESRRTSQKPFAQLSSGEKLKRRLKDGFSRTSKVLLLDEPTNHLDEASLAYLIEAVKGYQGTLVIVSHDRYFLDQVATVIWSIEEQQVKAYEGNYATFLTVRTAARKQQQSAYDKQQAEIKRVTKERQQLLNWSTQAHAQSTKREPKMMGSKEYFRKKAKRMDAQRKSIEKRLTAELATNRIQKVTPNHKVSFELESSQTKAGPLFLGEKLRKQVDGVELFANGELGIKFGERVALTGANGAGKTTLLKILLGEVSVEGKLWRSAFANIGYLSQEVYDLPLELTVAEYVTRIAKEKTVIRTLFVQLGFATSQWQTELSNLSMGERIKLKLLSYILTEKNVLVLDEPTNHLDTPSREELEKVLMSYKGTIILVSHDRYFRERVTNQTLAIENHQLVHLSAKAAKQVAPTELLLEFKRDQLLTELSLLAPQTPAYLAISKEFEEVLQQIKQQGVNEL